MGGYFFGRCRGFSCNDLVFIRADIGSIVRIKLVVEHPGRVEGFFLLEKRVKRGVVLAQLFLGGLTLIGKGVGPLRGCGALDHSPRPALGLLES